MEDDIDREQGKHRKCPPPSLYPVSERIRVKGIGCVREAQEAENVVPEK